MKPVVLIVDDEAFIREMLTIILELSGYDVAVAVDGRDALNKLQDAQPDAMILDMKMPNMDGLTLCREIRRRPESADLPIIMLSGDANLDGPEVGLAAGANYFMAKPMSGDELLDNLHTAVSAHAVAV